jgi:DNA-binding transcriptional MocR family regulator
MTVLQTAVEGEGARSLTERLAAQLGERIRAGSLPAGAKLPSVRECAKRYGVSPFTVVAAYDRLQAQGLIEAQRGRGFFVRGAAGARQPAAARRPQPPKPARVDAGWLIRGMFAQLADHAQPGSGLLPATWLDNPHVGPAMREAARTAPEHWLRYGDPQGLPVLREQLAQRVQSFGIPASAAQIITTNGATHALDLLCRALLHPGEAVLVESPGWFVEHARYAEFGVQVLGVPRLAEGPDLAVLEALALKHRPKLFICVSKLHNPTGYSLAPTHAHRLMQLAARLGFHVVEDDTYADFADASSSAATAPRLAALDGLQHSVYVSSFSKSLAPAWRCGFMAAPEALVDRLTDLKLLSTLTTQSAGELALHYVLATGAYRRHTQRLVEHLQRARERAVRLAEQHGCSFAAPPAQGMFGWVETGVDTEKLALALVDEQFVIAPGALFYPLRQTSTLMRINVATSGDARFWRVFARMRDQLARRAA